MELRDSIKRKVACSSRAGTTKWNKGAHLSYRDSESDSRAASFALAVYLYGAAHQFHQVFGYQQAQARAAESAAVSWMNLNKLLKQVALIFKGNTYARVYHGKIDKSDIALCDDAHRAFKGKFQGVGQ